VSDDAILRELLLRYAMERICREAIAEAIEESRKMSEGNYTVEDLERIAELVAK